MRINRRKATILLALLLAVSLVQAEDTAQGPPENRLKLSAAAAGQKVYLRWSGEIASDVVAIEILRGKGVDGNLELLDEITDLRSAAYTDDDVQPNTDYRYALRLRDGNQTRSAAGEPLAVNSGRYVRRINSGGEAFIGADGIPWEADKGRVSGTSQFTLRTTLAGVYPEMRPLYKTERWSHQSLRYEFDLAPGRYAIVLCFAETNRTFSRIGKRTFDILVGDEKVHEAFDVFSQAGANRPLHLTIHAAVTTSPLVVELRKNKAGPALKGIAVEGLSP